ncbi:extensin-like [Humulus lupulus]|uniref:extensin-like n=1 Tax=Humulus lupulus TaxID=3486 RepID=UPI002B4138AB|nr:extensin-like [Humulus lupulus]
MGRMKYIARRKKRTANSPSNQPAPYTEEPSTNPQPIKIVPPKIQTKARPRDGLRPGVEWYVAPPSIVSARMDVRESTVGNATGGEIPEQHQDVSQPPRRRATGVTIREPSNIPRAATILTQHGKGKQKLPKYTESILESSDENVMNSREAFDRYSKPKAKTSASKRKESRQHPGESSSDPSKKRARTKGPPTPVHSKETTPSPAPVNLTPPAPVDPTPPALVNPTPPD